MAQRKQFLPEHRVIPSLPQLPAAQKNQTEEVTVRGSRRPWYEVQVLCSLARRQLKTQRCPEGLREGALEENVAGSFFSTLADLALGIVDSSLH
jgi:hypothetical protein